MLKTSAVYVVNQISEAASDLLVNKLQNWLAPIYDIAFMSISFCSVDKKIVSSGHD